MTKAADIIAKLGLQPHPEGGWFRETWRAASDDGERPSGTLIHFLLESSHKSHWHKVDAAEIWLWHGGNPLQLSVSDPRELKVEHHRLGPDVAHGDLAHFVISPGDWQAAEPLAGGHDYALVSCVVSPGFDFAGFTLAPPGWHPEQ